MFKNQISHKADFFPPKSDFISPNHVFQLCWHTWHWFVSPHGNNLWELHLLQTDILTSLSQTPLYSFVSLTLRKHQLPFHLSHCFPILAVYAFMWPSLPRRHLSLLPSFSWNIWWIYMLSLLIYFHSCLPESLCFLFVPQFLFFLFLLVLGIFCLPPLFLLYHSKKYIYCFYSFSG